MNTRSEIPRTVDLMPEVVRALEQLGGTASSKTIDDLVIQSLGLPKHLTDQPHSEGKDVRTEIKYRLAWSRTLAKKTGKLALIETRTWTLRKS